MIMATTEKKNPPPEVGDHWRRAADGRTLHVQRIVPQAAACGVWLEDEVTITDPNDAKKTITKTREECAGTVLFRSLANPELFKLLKRG